MSMIEWAKREVELACKSERGGAPEDEWDYGCACYESALKAFESLCGDGHSGASIWFTKNIINQLIDGKPLTPIEDTEDIWVDVSRECCMAEGHKQYQCKRMSSLFKHIYPDGRVEYDDVDQYYCVNVGDPDSDWSYNLSFIDSIVKEIYPITMLKNPMGTERALSAFSYWVTTKARSLLKSACHFILKDWKEAA